MARSSSAALSFPKSAPTLVQDLASTRQMPKFDLAAAVACLESLEERSHDDDITIQAPAPLEEPLLGSPLGDESDDDAPVTSRMPKVEEQALIHWELELSKSGLRAIHRPIEPVVVAGQPFEGRIKHVVIGLWSVAIAMSATLAYLMATTQ